MKASSRWYYLPVVRGPSRCEGAALLELIISMSLAVVMLSSLAVIYLGVAKSVAKEENRMSAQREGRLLTQRLSREVRLTGLMALEDVDGDSNDIHCDVTGQAWTDSVRDDFERATTYELVITSDVDNDSVSETIRYFRNQANDELKQEIWEWSRDSLNWQAPVVRTLATRVDHVMFRYYDRDGNGIPVNFPVGEYVLTAGERRRVTAAEVTVVTRSVAVESGHPQFLYLPDGSYWYDGYRRSIYKFLIRGRNLSLGA